MLNPCIRTKLYAMERCAVSLWLLSRRGVQKPLKYKRLARVLYKDIEISEKKLMSICSSTSNIERPVWLIQLGHEMGMG